MGIECTVPGYAVGIVIVTPKPLRHVGATRRLLARYNLG
jgi:hypothetical protein